MNGNHSTDTAPRAAQVAASAAPEALATVATHSVSAADSHANAMAAQGTNPYLADSSPKPARQQGASVEEVDTAQCWRLLESVTLGRLAVEGSDGRPDVFPVNYLVHNGNVFIRSAPGTKLRSITKHPAVAFEIDGETAAFHWSVVLRGSASRMHMDTDIEASGVLGLISSSPTAKDNFIRLMPDTVTGRRFPKRQRNARWAVPLTARESAQVHEGRDLKPQNIPHHAPLPND